MLVAAGALPARDERLTALERWITRVIAERAIPGTAGSCTDTRSGITCAACAAGSTAGPPPADQVKNVRDHVTAAAAFLDWLEDREADPGRLHPGRP